MKHIITFVTLSVILSWISSGQAQTLTETVPPFGPTVVVVFTSSNGGLPILTTIATLSGSSNSAPKNSSTTSHHSTASSSSTSSAPSSSSTDSTDASDSDPSTHHIPSPVAMIAGSLAGFIAIVAAILVVCVTRRRRSGKRRRRRASIIRALEAQHAHSGENLDRDGSPISDSGSFSECASSTVWRFIVGCRFTIVESELNPHLFCLEEHSSTRRPGSTTRNFPRESGRSGKKKGSSRTSGKNTTHVHVSPSDDMELDWRDTNAGPQRTRTSPERSYIPTLVSPASNSTLTNSTSMATTLVTTSNSALDSKPKPILSNTHYAHAHAPHAPHAHSQDQSQLLSPNTHAPSSPVLNMDSPQPAIRPSLSLPTAHRSDGDLPPAYEYVR
ncbi:hypothetical protein CVT25_010434 [Psilocybe cyanescens]|uniref:Mid2 domain-containing protein n=1 Tax=Psilocybe cyanescens TaxID=93625 RepID=A0A409XNY6_PSICY|nr:hypothetical protein CVT25_010434 [Psilocybe cyanescens]